MCTNILRVVAMGDFERTFGAGVDAADVIDRGNYADRDNNVCKPRAGETLIKELEYGLGLFSLSSREDFYDRLIFDEYLHEGECDELYGIAQFDKPISGEQLLIIRQPDGREAAYIRVLGKVVMICELCFVGGGTYTRDLVDPLFAEMGWELPAPVVASPPKPFRNDELDIQF